MPATLRWQAVILVPGSHNLTHLRPEPLRLEAPSAAGLSDFKGPPLGSDAHGLSSNFRFSEINMVLLGPPARCPLLPTFLGEGSPKIDYRKKLVPLFYPLYLGFMSPFWVGEEQNHLMVLP